MATSVPELLAKISAARADVARLKRTIKATRDELGTAAGALRALELEARRLGVAIINPHEGGGANHGRQEARSRSHH